MHLEPSEHNSRLDRPYMSYEQLIFSKLDEALRTANLLNQGRSSPHVVLSLNEPGVAICINESMALVMEG